MTFEDLFSKIQEKVSKADVSGFDSFAAFEFQVKGETAGVFYVEIKDGKITAAPYNYFDRDALLAADGKTYMEILNGELNPLVAFAVGRLKITGNLEKCKNFKKCVDKVICI